MKHKHYECIVAWAEGRKIEHRCRNSDNTWTEWKVTEHPRWYLQDEYRIKKEPVIEVKYFREVFGNPNAIYSEIRPDLEKWDLKITYQDGVAVKAEVAE